MQEERNAAARPAVSRALAYLLCALTVIVRTATVFVYVRGEGAVAFPLVSGRRRVWKRTIPPTDERARSAGVRLRERRG